MDFDLILYLEIIIYIKNIIKELKELVFLDFNFVLYFNSFVPFLNDGLVI
jgi:hypothetical protein